MISYEDFRKLDLRVAKILKVERIEESRKLLRLQVEIGEEERQIVAGIGSAYELEDLIGRDIVVIVNLEPKTFMGQESQGMLLAANLLGESEQAGGVPVLLQPEREVPPGSKIR